MNLKVLKGPRKDALVWELKTKKDADETVQHKYTCIGIIKDYDETTITVDLFGKDKQHMFHYDHLTNNVFLFTESSLTHGKEVRLDGE